MADLVSLGDNSTMVDTTAEGSISMIYGQVESKIVSGSFANMTDNLSLNSNFFTRTQTEKPDILI